MNQIPEMTRRVFLNQTLQALGAAAAIPLAACTVGSVKSSTGMLVKTGSAAEIPRSIS